MRIDSQAMSEAPKPDLFVARDRARRFYRRIRDAQQDRRITYRGAASGMSSLRNEAEQLLTMVTDDIRDTIAALEEGRIRDRERGYMEVPFMAAAATVCTLASMALRVDRGLTANTVAAEVGQAGVLALLNAALMRLDAFVGNYDAKTPIGPSRNTDVAHVLEEIASWSRCDALASGGTTRPHAVYDKPPPRIDTDPAGLLDLLLAAHGSVSDSATSWRVDVDRDAGTFQLTRGEVGSLAPADGLPRDVERAREVLSHVHPLEVRAFQTTSTTDATGLLSTPSTPMDEETHWDGIEFLFLDETSAGHAVELKDAAGPDAVLQPEAEEAIDQLLKARATSLGDTMSPQHMIALMGVFKALDRTLKEDLLPRTRHNACIVAASHLPRMDTRRAPIQPAVVTQLETTFARFATPVLEDVAAHLRSGKSTSKHAHAAAMGVALALVGRTWSAGSSYVARSMVLDPLTEADVHRLIQSLFDIAHARAPLERGQPLPATDRNLLEHALILALGTLGRLL